jgi:hypothetical protein
VDPLPIASVAATLALFAVLALAPLPELGFALSISAVFALIGQGVAAYRLRRDARTEPTQITFAWAALGFAAGWIIVVLAEAVP